ncbi:MAG: hypothetical protein GTO62_19135 [Planctomycetales bacterium]|nr:hypothetical protein [Planctomycetales bacterium]NIP71302.1 hypothetical protein [Planctomycetales bacterium]
MRHLVKKFLADQEGAEVTELALVLAFIVAGSVAIIVLIGEQVQTFYEDTDNALP